MKEKLKELFGKKGILLLIGTVLVMVMNHLGFDKDIITSVAGLFGVGIAGFGLQDFGKAAPK